MLAPIWYAKHPGLRLKKMPCIFDPCENSGTGLISWPVIRRQQQRVAIARFVYAATVDVV